MVYLDADSSLPTKVQFAATRYMESPFSSTSCPKWPKAHLMGVLSDNASITSQALPVCLLHST